MVSLFVVEIEFLYSAGDLLRTATGLMTSILIKSVVREAPLSDGGGSGLRLPNVGSVSAMVTMSDTTIADVDNGKQVIGNAVQTDIGDENAGLMKLI